MSVWEENFGRKTKGKGAGSRSAWRFDLLWRIVCEIVCRASVPQPHLKKKSPSATGNKYQISSETMLPIVLRLLSSRIPTRIKTDNSLQDFHNTGHSILTHLPLLSTITNLSHWSINLLVTHLPVSVWPVCDRRPDQHQTSHGSPTLVTVRYPGGPGQHSSGLTFAYTTPLICLCQSHGISGLSRGTPWGPASSLSWTCVVGTTSFGSGRALHYSFRQLWISCDAVWPCQCPLRLPGVHERGFPGVPPLIWDCVYRRHPYLLPEPGRPLPPRFAGPSEAPPVPSVP